MVVQSVPKNCDVLVKRNAKSSCRTSTFHGFCAFILGRPEEPETVPDSHKVPEQSEEHPETINEQSDDDTVETTNNENIENNKENIKDAQIEEEKSSPINGEPEEEEQDKDEGETEVKRQSSGKSQQSEEEKSNHFKQPSIDRVSPEKLLEEDTEGEGVIEGKLHVVV